MPRPEGAARLLLCLAACARSRAESGAQALVGALEDASALVQGRAGASQLQASFLSSGLGLGARAGLAARAALEAKSSRNASDFDCSKYGTLCGEPFHCDQSTTPEYRAERRKTIALNGRANLHSWCREPQYWPNLVQHCLIRKDLVTAAWSVYEATANRVYGPMVPEMDGSYCFWMGHCTNTAVTPNTTLEEGEKMCDARFGHSAWAENLGWDDAKALSDPSIYSMEGFKDEKFPRLFSKMSCAMGNYHCDVSYCQQTYCKMPYFVRRYAHLLPKVPGHLLVQKD